MAPRLSSSVAYLDKPLTNTTVSLYRCAIHPSVHGSQLGRVRYLQFLAPAGASHCAIDRQLLTLSTSSRSKVQRARKSWTLDKLMPREKETQHFSRGIGPGCVGIRTVCGAA